MANLIWPVVLITMFLLYSVPLFLRVYSTTQLVIDEKFHLPQGLHFCNKRFDVWDPKITTFPGLYLAALILSPLNMCSVLGLRLISLAAASANVIILYKIRVRALGGTHRALAALESFTVAALPPLYFFTHIYYTEALSLTTVLLMYYYWDKQMHLQASVYGAASVLMRQTNVVWLGMLFGITALDILTKNYAESEKKNRVKDVVPLFSMQTWIEMLTSYRVLGRSICSVLLKCSCYLIIILPFIGFVFLNGAIVLGDKTAHEATLHLPQLFYFSMFAAAFSPTHIVFNLRPVLSLVRRNLLKTVLAVSIFVLVVKQNTLVHPYLLADNRHYEFYMWNRFYGRYSWFKYAMTPIYALALLLLHQTLRLTRDSFKLMFWLAVVMALCFQRLLEFRYFLIPFVVLRLNARPVVQRKNKNMMLWQWLELCLYIAINATTFYIFFNKEIVWSGFKEPQRIIW